MTGRTAPGRSRTARIHVLAGVNGAGKSSIAGAAFRSHGADYFNPDEAARMLREADPSLGRTEANAAAWQHGRRMLERVIRERLDYAFETTLGGATIPRLLAQAAADGIEVHVWYAGLDSADLHVRRVQARVRRGGHPIDEADIRRRYRHSRMNLIALLPVLTALNLYDNSIEADPADGHAPQPRLVLQMKRGRIIAPADLGDTPGWAKSIVAAALALAPA